MRGALLSSLQSTTHTRSVLTGSGETFPAAMARSKDSQFTKKKQEEHYSRMNNNIYIATSVLSNVTF